jgi:hypothetical protein
VPHRLLKNWEFGGAFVERDAACERQNETVPIVPV